MSAITTPPRAAVRATFALVTALFLAPFTLQHVTQREPFPALKGPRFSGVGPGPATPRWKDHVEVDFRDGPSRWLNVKALIESVPPRQRGWVVRALLRAANGPSQAAVLAWFRDALAREFPGRVPLRIRKFELTRDPELGARARGTLAWEAELGRP